MPYLALHAIRRSHPFAPSGAALSRSARSLAVAALLAASPAAPSPALSAAPGPTLAVEDTMRTEVPEVLVRAPRVTLDEILDRVARGEARRDSLLRDVVFTATLRVVRDPDGAKGPQLIEERVSRVYRKKPGKVRTVNLRTWRLKPSKRMDAEVSFSSDTEEEIVNFAFRPEARRDFRYRIVGRDLLGDHLIYRIAFEPRSLLGATDPGGLVWVDTRDFVIVRQELDFPRSPAPLFIKGIDRAVIERQEVDGHWVLRRLLMRAHFTVPVPRFGRALDMAVQFDDYAINQGIADTVFAKAVRP